MEQPNRLSDLGSPDDEHWSSCPRPVNLCSDQYIFQFLFRTTNVYKNNSNVVV